MSGQAANLPNVRYECLNKLPMLQRMVEDLEYRHLLDRAAAAADPAERTLFVAAFIASGYSSTLARESKPFNPLLGETFEWQSADSSCRFVCEQVGHAFAFPSMTRLLCLVCRMPNILNQWGCQEI